VQFRADNRPFRQRPRQTWSEVDQTRIDDEKLNFGMLHEDGQAAPEFVRVGAQGIQ
jgi:hypothetical protein